MEEKRIKIKSQISLWKFIFIVSILVIIACTIFYSLFNGEHLSYATRHHAVELVGMIFFIIPLIYGDFLSKKEYLSDIYITDDKIKLVYKIRDKITKTKILEKNNIKSFVLKANINVTNMRRYSKTDVCYKFFVDLIEGQDIHVSDISDTDLTESNYKFIYKILDAAKYIPNFKFNIESNNDIIKAEIEYYIRFGKTIPFWTKFKMYMNKCPLFIKAVLFFSFAIFVFLISMQLTIIFPVNLNSTEKQYIELIKKSYDYKNRYNEAIYELDKAKNLISTDPYLYYRYAYIYKSRKDYSNAIYYAKKGISNLGNKEVYHKQYRFIKSTSDIYLYELLGDCYKDLKEWENAIEAYTYVVNSKNKWKYSDIYFTRGRMYFELKKYADAKKDFIKHREIVLDYIKTYEKENYANKYTQKHLININKWIKACDAWEKYSNENP